MEWAGTLHLSWWELREFIVDLLQDPRSSYFKRIHPKDYIWFDPVTKMLAENANIAADLRMYAVVDRLGEEGEIPEDYLVRFGPPDEPASESGPEVADADDRARAAAAEILG